MSSRILSSNYHHLVTEIRIQKKKKKKKVNSKFSLTSPGFSPKLQAQSSNCLLNKYLHLHAPWTSQTEHAQVIIFIYFHLTTCMLHEHLKLNMSSLSSLSTFTSIPALPPPGVSILENDPTIHSVIQVRNLSTVLNFLLFLSLKYQPSIPFISPA